MKDLKQNENTELAIAIAKLIDVKKGQNIELFDVSKQSSMIDYMVVATASNTTLTKAIADYVEEELKKIGVRLLRRDGVNNWIVLDYNEILVHIFTPDIKDMYHLEKIWTSGKNVFSFEELQKLEGKEEEVKKPKKEIKQKAKDNKETKKEEKQKKEKKTKQEKTTKTVKEKPVKQKKETKEKVKKTTKKAEK